MRLFIPFLLLAAVAPAQVISVGVKAGIPATNALPDYGAYYPGMIDTGRWTIGPTIEFHLFSGLSIEVDALYRGYRQDESFASGETTIPAGPSTAPITYPAISFSNQTSTKAWDVPMLLKYRFGTRRFRPFVDAGATFSHTSSDVTSSIVCLSSETVCGTSNFQPYYNQLNHSTFTMNTFGPTAGVGVEYKIGKFKLAPEVRFTHLSNPTRNLATVLLGFTF
ncbi:conserved exported hypothetical protein [Candidatus Sulfopaludibacter sp. SbA3]|nr:conserved exported hypothetical protein [Candidatus Sulfopaludibacter sp. SbA3]